MVGRRGKTEQPVHRRIKPAVEYYDFCSSAADKENQGDQIYIILLFVSPRHSYSSYISNQLSGYVRA